MRSDNRTGREVAFRIIAVLLGILVMCLGLGGLTSVVVAAAYAFAHLSIVLGLIAGFLGLAFFLPFFSSLISLGISLIILGHPR